MIDDFTRYTDTILSAVSMHFQDAPEVRSKKTGKTSSGNFLPTLIHIYNEKRVAFAGLFTDLLLDAEKLQKAFTEYVRMVAKINEYTEFVPDRANFCAYLGINTMILERMLQDASQPIREAYCSVEDYFVSLYHIGAMQGEIGSNATKLILQTAGRYGHNQVTVKEASEIRINETRLASPEELEQRLKMITSGNK